MENLFQLSDKPDHFILQQVGWVRLAHEISVKAHFEYTKIELSKSPKTIPLQKIKELQELLKIYQKALIDDDSSKYLQSIYRIPPSLEPKSLLASLVKKEIFSLQEINHLVLFYESNLLIPRALVTFNVNHALLNETKEKEILRFIKEFRSFVDISGSADFFQHPIIGPLIRELSEHEKRASEIINQEMKTLQDDGRLQQTKHDIIEGRYVVSIRTDKYSYSLGNIVHRSDSGSTLYVELKKMIEYSEKRNQIKEKINYEIFLLEKNYSKIIKESVDLYEKAIKKTFENDSGFAKAKWANGFNGTFPEIISGDEIKLHSFYHPNIENPVKNDLDLQKKKIMLISGPNTGGKSVIIKSLSINYLLAYSGYPIAAEYSSMGHFDSLYYLASDGQDIDKGLSSFSSEAKSILEVVEKTEKKALLLVDEIFSSTSSEEASILAYSVMKVWMTLKKGVAIFTSHHHTLKTLVHANSEMESAHVGFDLKKSIPTYILTQGVPGSSFAVAIFSSMLINCKSKELLEFEIEQNQKNVVDYEDLLKKHTEKEHAMQHELNGKIEEYEKLKNDLKIQLLDFEEKKKQQFTKYKTDLEILKQKGRRLIDELISGKTKITKNTLDNEWWSINKELAQHDSSKNVDDKEKIDLLKAENITIGKYYYSTQWKKTVEVISISQDKKTAEVMMGKIKTRVKCDELYVSDKIVSKHTIQTTIKREFDPVTTLDARGMRLDEFQRKVDIALSFVISGDVPYLEIIHGHGDGILKNWLTMFLKENRETFKYENPESSYGGSTRIYLI